MLNNPMPLVKYLPRALQSVKIFLLLIASFTSSFLFAQAPIAIENDGYKLVIDNIVCRGNENTQCEFITKKYYQNIGENVDPEEIADARLRLGTLQQFKNVDIVLEKADIRGHVSVIFVVDEAQHVQYNLRTSYARRDINDFYSDVFNQTVGVTDFNFLGSAKQLSFNAVANYNKYPSSRFYNLDQKNYRAGLLYYDPHLSDSVDYFLSADLNYYSFTRPDFVSYLDEEGNAHFGSESSQESHYSFSMDIGRRFGSHSYVSFGAGGSKANSTTNFNIAYGWDSTDDKIFPTKGSIFHSEIAGFNDWGEAYFSLKYTKYSSFTSRYTFSYGIDEYINHSDDSRIKRASFNPQLKLTLTDIDSSGSISGKYTGWRYHLSVPIRDIATKSVIFGLSYIHQTDKLIYDFSLSYQSDFGEL
jgi:outer membrane protein assembly factor BamA